MPEHMPEDFNFAIQFGIGKKNEINTFENTVTKDLILDGTATTEINFTKEQMNNIYKKMKEINILETKKFTPKSDNCVQQPHGEDEWKIRIDGRMVTVFISGKYCTTTNDARQLIRLRDYIFNIVKNKPEYKQLPNSKGMYH